MLKTILSSLSIIGICLSIQAQDEPQIPSSESMDSLQTKVMKLIDFYDSYEDGSPESLKKAKYNDAVDEMSEGTATQQDKNDAFKIIDAYIKADKAPDSDHQNDEAQDFDSPLKNTDEVKAGEAHLNQQKTMLMQMSYPEFEAYVLNGNPLAGKKETKEAYNAMHKTDGKHVAVTQADEEMTETQKQVWAFGILENPKNYEEFRKACKILKPSATESEIREAWEKMN